MNTKEEFTQIIEAENKTAIIPFLKKLAKGDRKRFLPFLKKQVSFYFARLENEKGWFIPRGSETQRNMLYSAGFLCYNQKEFQETFWSFDIEAMDEVLEFYVPSWFNKYIIGFKNIDTVTESLTYIWLVDKIQKGQVDNDNLLIARVLCNTIYPLFYEEGSKYGYNTHEYKPENLEYYEVTLKEHFWLIFHYETNIYYTERWYGFIDGIDKKEVTWIKTICKLVNEKKLPRQRVLQEAINGTTRNFNRNLVNWYMDLFLALEPSQEEILGIQNDFFQVFNSPQSKPINEVLKICKKLVTKEDFDKKVFLENTPVLLTSETKSIVNSTLMILDKMGKKDKKLQSEIALLCCEVFIQKEESIQLRAAKMIHQFGSLENEVLKSALMMYQDEIMFSSKDFLKDFFNDTEDSTQIEVEEVFAEIEPLISESNKIELPNSVDDFIFLFSQALDGNESWHLDFLQASVLKFHPQMNIEIIGKLEPAFQKAYKLVFDWTGNRRLGYLDLMAAHFVLEYTEVLLQQFPNEEKIIGLKNTQEKKEAKKKKEWHHHKTAEVSLSGWYTGMEEEIYFPFKYMLMNTLSKVLQKDSLPLLSTPTHQPYWIDPSIYVERLFEYQEKNIMPHHTDWQVAIARVAIENLEKAIDLANEKLKGEWLDLTLFIFDKIKMPSKKQMFPNEWRMAVYSKFPKLNLVELKNIKSDFKIVKELLGELDYSMIQEEKMETKYDYEKKKSVETGNLYMSTEMQIEGTSYHLNLRTDKKKPEDMPLYNEKDFFLLEYLYLKETPLGEQGQDLKRLISLTPKNIQIILAQVNKLCFNHSEFWEEETKKTTIRAGSTLLENWRGGGTMAYYYIAGAMNCSDKTARGIAAEIWIKGVSENTLDSKLLGKLIGEMESIEFFPIKRLTDLIMQFMMKISKRHNQQLEIMVKEILQRLPDKPIRNTKKLLEIYRELLASNASTIDNEKVKQKLENWKSNGSLKKITKELIDK